MFIVYGWSLTAATSELGLMLGCTVYQVHIIMMLMGGDIRSSFSFKTIIIVFMS